MSELGAGSKTSASGTVTPIELTPEFSSQTFSYAGSLPNNMTHLAINVTKDAGMDWGANGSTTNCGSVKYNIVGSPTGDTINIPTTSASGSTLEFSRELDYDLSEILSVVVTIKVYDSEDDYSYKITLTPAST